jgi:hypothetical protein
MSKGLFAAALALTAVVGRGAAADSEPVSVRVQPERALSERSGTAQYFNFEFILTSSAPEPIELVAIYMKGYDRTGRLIVWPKLDSNGKRPGIETLGPRRVEPGKALTVFNPFFRVDTAVPLHVLRYEFRFARADGRRQILPVDVHPIEYVQKTRLILPVAGARLWVYEGADLYSHHRRIDLMDPFNRDVLKMRGLSERYALDLVVLDDHGEIVHGDLDKREDWVGWGFPVVAPADGTVLAARGDRPDDIPEDEEALAKDPGLSVGNCLTIDHGNGEYSVLAHFQKGSLKVKPGDRVRQGQVVARMGWSGMGSRLVHVHYELQDSPDLFAAEGLPTRFEGFRRVGSDVDEAGRIEPGWVVVTAGSPAPK